MLSPTYSGLGLGSYFITLSLVTMLVDADPHSVDNSDLG
jgi:hypothetical protein